MKKLITQLLILSFLIFINSCKKENNSTQNSVNNPGLVASIDGVAFNPSQLSATYYPKWHELTISANEGLTPSLNLGINIDSINPITNYLLQSNGDNVAEIKINTVDGQFDSDHNIADAGGNFELTEFDTTQKILSGNLQFISYSQSRSIRKVFSDGVLTHIPFTIDTTGYDGSYAECTVTGATSHVWHTKNFWAQIFCIGNNIERLKLEINSILGGYANNRFISITIPLVNPMIGTHQIETDLQLACATPVFTSSYTINDFFNGYYAISGTLNITSIDTALKKMDANFNITYQDTTTGRHEIIQITNGHVHLNNWRNY